MNNTESTLTPSSPFHKGEQQIQEMLGVREKMEHFGRQVIRDYLTPQHREIFSQLPFVFVGHSNQQGDIWASMLFQQAGFITSSEEKKLQLNCQPVPGDPLHQGLQHGQRLGLLGIELATRRRNRVSTEISGVSDQGIELSVLQTFGNCPQYIQNRSLYTVKPGSMPLPSNETLYRLDQQAQALISDSDTFFVASAVAENNQNASTGADISHRGGKPGFVRVDNEL